MVLTTLAFYVAFSERDELGVQHWWVLVFPALAVVTAYRLVRPRVPLVLDHSQLRVDAGQTLLRMRTSIDWNAVKRIRVTAAGLVLIELRDWQRWSADKPWLVRANMRTNSRKFNAAVVQPLRELQGSPAAVVSRIAAVAPVKVDAPEGWKAGG